MCAASRAIWLWEHGVRWIALRTQVLCCAEEIALEGEHRTAQANSRDTTMEGSSWQKSCRTMP